MYRDDKTVWRERVLERRDHRRARVRLAGEYVDFGSREIRDHAIPDRYYRLEADFSYLLLGFPLKSLRLGPVIRYPTSEVLPRPRPSSIW